MFKPYAELPKPIKSTDKENEKDNDNNNSTATTNNNNDDNGSNNDTKKSPFDAFKGQGNKLK